MIVIDRVLSEVGLAVSNRNRVSPESEEMISLLSAIGSGGLGAVASLTALYFAGITGLSAAGITSGLAALGGTMVGGVAVLAVPVAVLGILGYKAHKRREHKKFAERLDEYATNLTKPFELAVQEAITSDRRTYLSNLQKAFMESKKNLASCLSKG